MPRPFVELRQGDVFLVRIPKTHKIKETTRIPAEKDRIVLAHGEVTGHAHALPKDQVELYEIDLEAFASIYGGRVKAKAANTRLLRVLEPVDLLHEEHDPIRLEPGNYLVSIQLAFDEDEEWGHVKD